MSPRLLRDRAEPEGLFGELADELADLGTAPDKAPKTAPGTGTGEHAA